MTKITLRSNNAKALHEAADLVERVGWNEARDSYYFKNLVRYSIGDIPPLDDYTLYKDVVVKGPILW
jgi:hypothetical protein